MKLPRSQPRPAPNDVVDDGLGNDIRTRLMVLILTDTGIRRGELCQIHNDHIERDLTGYTLRVTGKGGHVRLVPLSDDLARTLAYTCSPDGSTATSPRRTSAEFLRALDDGWTAHTLRHRFASLAYAVDRDIRAVQNLIGHASVSGTQICTLVLAEAMRRAATGARSGLTAA